MTRSHVTWFIHVWHAWIICATTNSYMTCLIHVHPCDMTHSYMTCLIPMWHAVHPCDMTHSHVPWLKHMWHDSFLRHELFIRVTWHICVHGVTRSHLKHWCYICEKNDKHVNASFAWKIMILLVSTSSRSNDKEWCYICEQVNKYVNKLTNMWLAHIFDVLFTCVTSLFAYVTH